MYQIMILEKVFTFVKKEEQSLDAVHARRLAGYSCKTKHATDLMSTYLGRHNKKEAAAVANKLSLGHNNQKDAATFQAMATYINTSVSTQRGMKRHINAFFGKRKFETDTALKARVESRVENHMRIKFEFTQLAADPKCVNTKDAYSREYERVLYWYRDPSQRAARYIAGQVADYLKNEGRTVITPYVTTQNGHKQQGMPVLIGADHGKGAWRRYLKIFSHDVNMGASFKSKQNTRRSAAWATAATISRKRLPSFAKKYTQLF
jgi:hypothetical protein